jgi:hypothetical protein
MRTLRSSRKTIVGRPIRGVKKEQASLADEVSTRKEGWQFINV